MQLFSKSLEKNDFFKKNKRSAFIEYKFRNKWDWKTTEAKSFVENILVQGEWRVITSSAGLFFYRHGKFVYQYPIKESFGDFGPTDGASFPKIFFTKEKKLILLGTCNESSRYSFFMKFDLSNALFKKT